MKMCKPKPSFTQPTHGFNRLSDETPVMAESWERMSQLKITLVELVNTLLTVETTVKEAVRLQEVCKIIGKLKSRDPNCH
jgi:hypothetical protein